MRSMAGAEMTTLARNHSGRVSALVYLDAIADLEDDPPADKEWATLAQKMPSRSECAARMLRVSIRE